MADKTDSTPGEAPDKAKSSRLPLVPILLLVFAAVGAGGGFWAWKHYGHAAAAHHATVAKAGPPVLVTIPTILSNLDTGGHHVAFVKLSATLEVGNDADARQANAAMPRIQDAFQSYLHETRPEELQGAGAYRLKEALFQRIALLLDPVPVRNLYFVQLLVQ